LMLSDREVSIGCVSGIDSSPSPSQSPGQTAMSTPAMLNPTYSRQTPLMTPTRKVFTSSGTLMKSPFPPSPDFASVEVGKLFHHYYPNQPAPPNTLKYFSECVRSGKMTLSQVEDEICKAIQQYMESRPNAPDPRIPLSNNPPSPRPSNPFMSSPATNNGAAAVAGQRTGRILKPTFTPRPRIYHPIEESGEYSKLSLEAASAFLDQCQKKYCGDYPIPKYTRDGFVINLTKGERSRADIALQIRQSKEGIQFMSQQMKELKMLVTYLNNAVKILCPKNLPTQSEVSDIARQLQDGTKTWEQALDELDKRNTA